MGTPGPLSQVVSSKRVFVLSALAGAIATTLIGCGGGAAGSVSTNECGPSELTKAGGGCTSVKLVDTNGDNNADGVDVSGDGIPEMVFVAGGPSTKGLDLNGDGNADYFLQTTDNKLRIFGTADASGVLVTVVVSPGGELIGLDSNGDRASDDNRLNDKVAPSIHATPNGGTLLRAPNVALECSDNVACNAIAYTLDGSEPVFTGTSTVVAGRSASVQMTANTVATLKFRARDTAGNLGGVKTAEFTIGCPTSGQLPNAAGGCVNPAQMDITRDGTPDGFDFDGNGVPEVLFLAGTPRGLDLDGDGLANYYWAIDANGLWSMSVQADGTGPVRVVSGDNQAAIGFDTNDDGTSDNNLLADVVADAAMPTVTVSPGGGNYSTAQIITLACSDAVACDAISYTLDGSEPNFISNGTVVPGTKATIQLALNATPRIRAIARDAKGNASSLADASYRIGCPSNPIARAGADLELSIGDTAQFNGTTSSTDNGTITSYKWTQTASGNAPTMNGGNPFTAATPQFTAPFSITTLHYQLEVTDSNNCKAVDDVFAYVTRDKTRAVFVSGDKGNDTTGDGSRAKPLATLSLGVAAAAIDPTAAKDVYVVSRAANADYTEPTILIVPANVSLFGGFDSQWVRDPENNRTSLQSGAATAIDVTVGINRASHLAGFNVKALAASANSSTNSFAMKVHGISNTNTSFTSRHNTLTAGNVGDGTTGAATPGSSYGLHVSSVQTVVVENSNVTSGKGGKGISGSAGATGAPGVAGATATTFTGAAGGSSPDQRITIGGGAGGNGGAEGGNPVYGAVAGTAGLGNTGTIDGKGGLIGQDGTNGGNGNNGSVGPSGVAATAAGTGLGSVSAAGFYLTSNGSTGISGGNGGGGGGGAGGSGGIALIGAPLPGAGGGGGGGGSGAIGSRGGLGGIGGGASVGLVVDKVKTLSVTQQTTITTNQGGNAGAGGVGGATSIGGNSGKGAAGGTRAGIGGTGGKGGNGGAGGDGAGGGGGPSIGIFVGAQVEATIDSTTTITVGNGGTGGDTRNGVGGQGGNVYGVFDADPTLTRPALANPAGITLGTVGTGGLKVPGGSGNPGTLGVAEKINW